MKQQGFTLVELLVVIAILGILVTLGLGAFRSSQAKGRDSQRKGAVKNISIALELFYNDKGSYPSDDASGNIMGCAPDDATLCPWGEAFVDKNNTVYMTELPKDPLTGYTYYYDASGTNNSSFQLYGRLENVQDQDILILSGLSCGLNPCNYGISSTNTTPQEGR